MGLQTLVTYGLALAIPALYLAYRLFYTPTPISSERREEIPEKPAKSIMQAPREDLAPPKDDPYTSEELKKFDGKEPGSKIYVAIKGTIFDVTHKVDVYGPGKSYSIFAGKDGSKGLGMSSLKPEDAVSDYSDLNDSDMKVLNDWHSFFSKRYNIVGKVVDPPATDPPATGGSTTDTSNL